MSDHVPIFLAALEKNLGTKLKVGIQELEFVTLADIAISTESFQNISLTLMDGRVIEFLRPFGTNYDVGLSDEETILAPTEHAPTALSLEEAEIWAFCLNTLKRGTVKYRRHWFSPFTSVSAVSPIVEFDFARKLVRFRPGGRTFRLVKYFPPPKVKSKT